MFIHAIILEQQFSYTPVAVETAFSALLSFSFSFLKKVFGDLFCWGFSSSSSFITFATFNAFTLQYFVLHYKKYASKRKTRAVVVLGDHLPISQRSREDVILYHSAAILWALSCLSGKYRNLSTCMKAKYATSNDFMLYVSVPWRNMQEAFILQCMKSNK